ncbi:peptidase family m3 [Aspergillus terreus]|uniref:Peptidase family m3 n=1 Tax=Aspergillus terreus TaxID=33178 RepID=A0A5M3Z822_ASPTE|nr:hypothetical protein ATETN484_0011030900 [Aspergillus terreus]GFF18946.1 peptidase family m3 [Aspergillus terreus]
MGVFDSPVSTFEALLGRHAWIAEVAGILPLSALIEFIDIPEKLHIFQLTGAVPLWSWPITPSGSRLLLSDQYPEQECYFDRYGKSMALLAVDGQFGEHYTVHNPETVRQCLATQTQHIISNPHEDMSAFDPRIRNLEFVHVVRLGEKESHPSDRTWLCDLFTRSGASTSLRYLVVSTFGWGILFGMIVMSAILRSYLSLAFLATVLGTGLVTFSLHGRQPRRLLAPYHSSYNRLVLVTEHVYSANWTAFYGESTIVSALLQRPLEHGGPRPSQFVARCLFMVLRILILGQWALVIGAAALKSWDAYFTTFWITFCILSHAYLIPPRIILKSWMRYSAGIQIKRFTTRISSERALLNTIIALNPGTFSLLKENCEDRTKFNRDGIKWLDSILAPSFNRSRWEEATREAMNAAAERYPDDETLVMQMRQDKDGHSLGSAWNSTYPTGLKNYWKPYILEGIYMAAKLRFEAKASGRKLPMNI